MRAAMRAAAPEASEKVSYGVPPWYPNGDLGQCGAFKRHIGFHPGPGPWDRGLPQRPERYHNARGAVRFPLDESL
jgi:uncharacterized protein YdhG (YjbR/CyaY superfamily)